MYAYESMKTTAGSLKKFVCCSVLGLMGFASGNAAILVTYDFTGLTGASPTPVKSVDELLSATSMTMGDGLTPTASMNRSEATGFATGGAAGTLNTALNDYWEFTITPDAGYMVSLEVITFSFARGGNGPQNLVFRSSLDGYTTNITPAQTGITASIANSLSFTLSGVENVSSPLTIRLYGYGATTGGSGGALLNNELFTVNGSVTPVPEPATIGLVLLAGGGMWLMRRKRA